MDEITNEDRLEEIKELKFKLDMTINRSLNDKKLCKYLQVAWDNLNEAEEHLKSVIEVEAR